MTTLPTAVTEADLRASLWSLSTHLNMGGLGHSMTKVCPDFPEVLVCQGWSRKRKADAKQHYSVFQIRRADGNYVEVPLSDPAEAARVISKVRQGVADDLEWEAADPNRKAIEEMQAAMRAKIAEMDE